MELSITFRRTDELSPYTRKLRFNDKAVSQMAEVLREFGFRIPVLTTAAGEIIDGHLRLKAAIHLGMTEIPTIVCEEWSEVQVKAFRLAVNRSASWATWNLEALAQ